MNKKECPQIYRERAADITTYKLRVTSYICNARNVQDANNISERNVQGMAITCERIGLPYKNLYDCQINFEGKVILQVREMYRGQIDHTDRHYIKMFDEQLTSTFEVLVMIKSQTKS